MIRSLHLRARGTSVVLALSLATALAGCGGGATTPATSAGIDAVVATADQQSPAIDARSPASSKAGNPGLPPSSSQSGVTVTSDARTLSVAWIAPQTNADGTPITDLAGYRLRWGTRSGSYTHTVQIDSPATLNHVLKGLAPRTYYLIVSAFNSHNIESAPSAEVSKAIR